MHPYVHCSITQGGQDVETTRVSFDRLLNKDVVLIYSGTLLNHKKVKVRYLQQHVWILRNHAKQNNSDRKSQE